MVWSVNAWSVFNKAQLYAYSLASPTSIHEGDLG